ncbi:MAG: hypothetical protein K0Q95_2254 [Bacteroidota bacterium]|jgi:hypothetical protein|nr:hypothetical protein [Bacteroidota bacterium]
MKIVKVIIVIFIARLLISLTACCKTVYKYYFNNIQLVNLDNSGKSPVETSEKVLSAASFGIRVKMNKVIEYSQTGGFGVSDAYAFSCAREVVPKKILRAIRLFTLTDFDSTHLSGSEITNYFLSRRSDQPEKSYSAMDDFVIQINSEKSSYHAQDPYYDFFLTASPKLDSVNLFRVEFNYRDTALVAVSDTLILR